MAAANALSLSDAQRHAAQMFAEIDSGLTIQVIATVFAAIAAIAAAVASWANVQAVRDGRAEGRHARLDRLSTTLSVMQDVLARRPVFLPDLEAIQRDIARQLASLPEEDRSRLAGATVMATVKAPNTPTTTGTMAVHEEVEKTYRPQTVAAIQEVEALLAEA